MISTDSLKLFIRESNAIEGIGLYNEPDQLAAYLEFLNTKIIYVGDMEKFVSRVAPGVRVRRHKGMDVRVGSHIPMKGGPEVEMRLIQLLSAAQAGKVSPFDLHCMYEYLHPFMDGNGRSGRVLWLWMMTEHTYTQPSSFLHEFYYQTLRHHHES